MTDESDWTPPDGLVVGPPGNPVIGLMFDGENYEQPPAPAPLPPPPPPPTVSKEEMKAAKVTHFEVVQRLEALESRIKRLEEATR